MAIISNLLVHNWYRHTPEHTCTHRDTYTPYSNTLSTAAKLLHFSILSLFCRDVSLLRCLVTKGLRETLMHLERDRKTKRERRRGVWWCRGRKRLTQIAFTSFSSIDLKQIFTVSAVQATGSEISPSAQTPEDLIQTGCPSVTVSALSLP